MTDDRSVARSPAGAPTHEMPDDRGPLPEEAEDTDPDRTQQVRLSKEPPELVERPAVLPGGSGRQPLDRPTARSGRYDPRGAGPRPAARRRTRLGLVRVDPWSVFVLSLLVSLFLGIVLLVAVGVLYSVLDSLGVLDSLNTFARDLQVIGPGQSVVTLSRVLGIAAVLAAVDVVLLTVLATLSAFLYNLCASITGGLEVVLAERD